jgi:predicted Zn-dependent protease
MSTITANIQKNGFEADGLHNGFRKGSDPYENRKRPVFLLKRHPLSRECIRSLFFGGYQAAQFK